jgi:hypothetical protein
MIFNRALRHTGQHASTPNAKKPLHTDSGEVARESVLKR